MGFISNARSTITEIIGTGKILGNIHQLLPNGHWSQARLVQEKAEQIPNNMALYYLDERYTWREFNERCNQYSEFFLRQGVGRGDTVAFMMDNRPDFLFIQTALNRIRAVGAFINTNLTGKGLSHAINVAGPRVVVAGSEHVTAVKGVLDDLEGLSKDRDVWIQREDEKHKAGNFRVINAEVDECPRGAPVQLEDPRTSEGMCYIYTSGTTGLPKAAIISNQRWLTAANLFGRTMFESTPRDIIYVSLPLYHSSAQFAGWGPSTVTGAALALRRKFSATNFWKDVLQYNATGFVYIGELCRYLLNQPAVPEETRHHLRIAVGNGLRPDIWEKFQARFHVPLIREFYGATEGNAPLVNIEGRPGMIGRLRPGQVIVKCDPASGEAVRNAQGLCDYVKAGEKGLLLGKINAVMRFDGYADKKATEKKILRDVRKKGDRFFNTGDVVQLHDEGWVSFADRVGDTFRWKGENVSTNEVAEILNGAKGILESNVYGVQVANSDGRAGMASLNVSGEFDVRSFGKFVNEKLPNYMRPYFIRVQHDMRITGTLKHQKVDYRDEGFDPAKVKDPLYYLDGEKYVPIDAALYKKLSSGETGPR